MNEAYIKPDPEAQAPSPAVFAEEDIYEDAGDLDFNTDPKFQTLYLARVPKYVWEEWAKLDDDTEIHLGTIRQTKTIVNGEPRHKLQMLLKSDLAQHQNVPKEYDLQITSEKVNNTFVFTEQDLPGFKSKSRLKFDPATANMPARLNKPKPDKSVEKQPWDRSKRFQPYFRRAIPKKTALAGRIAHEVNCTVVANAESDEIMKQRTFEGMKPKAGTIFLQGDTASATQGFIQPGTVQATSAFGGFIKNAPVGKKVTQEIKTARMPQNDLLDLIFACFRRYAYWSMKSLRAELRQPEAFLRETLEKVADLPKSGKFAMHWTLKPGYKTDIHVGVNEDSAPTAPAALEGLEDSDMDDVEGGEEDDDDEDIKFEDVGT